MANVSDAMKRHQAEVATRAADEDAPEAQPPGQDPSDSTMIDIELAGEADHDAAPGPPPQAPAPSGAPPRPADRAALAAAQGAAFSDVVVAHHDRGSGITEEYRSLRTNLLAKCTDGRFGYIVTSAEAGEGKTVTCLNLAVVLAERSERTTLLVDGDLRKGSAAKMLRVPGKPGMVDVLRGELTLQSVIQPTVYPNLFFLPAGKANMNEIGTLLSRMEREDIFTDVRRRYDYVLVDTPPINVAADAGVLGQSIGDALLIVRMNKTRTESVEKAIRLLHAANVNLSGLVLTHRKYYIPNYIYRYS